MKKNIMLLSVLATLLFALPSAVNAATSFEDNDGDGVYENASSISMGQFGNIAAGDMTWTYSDEEEGIKTWTISFETSHKFIYFSLIPSSVSIDSVTVGGTGFAKVGQDSSGDGIADILIENGNSGSARVTVTVITTDTADEGCQLNVSPLNLNCSVNIPGIYFDDNGNEISAEKYQEVCGNTTTPDDPNDVPNSQTGSVVPYVAIGGGLLAIVAVYLFSRKANKVYKI